jgi:long-subunit acyl-CoA synthetase (AMP-forming)
MKLIVTSTHIGTRDNQRNIEMLSESMRTASLPKLKNVVLLKGKEFMSYQQMILNGTSIFMNNLLVAAKRKVRPDDICNMQFTSGTTGSPKAAQLSHM